MSNNLPTHGFEKPMMKPLCYSFAWVFQSKNTLEKEKPEEKKSLISTRHCIVFVTDINLSLFQNKHVHK